MILIFLVYGIVIGSFLNVLILRIPVKEEFVKTRSHCTQCGYQLRWYDLVPIISYLTLQGKCRECKTKISIQYPLIELLNGAAYLGIYLYSGIAWETIISCIVFSLLLVIFMIDLRHKIIPNGLVIAIFIVSIFRMIMLQTYFDSVIGFFTVSLFLLLLALLTKGGMGMGDIKLMAASGVLLGWQNNILALMIGAVLGSVIGVSLIIFKVIKRKQMIPFGPFLTIGIFVAMLFGDILVQWYISMILI